MEKIKQELWSNMPISFESIKSGHLYSRGVLAAFWGYRSFQAIARGVVTPKNDNKIVIFVTEEKQASAEQYADRLSGNFLEWEGPNDHFAESRMLLAELNGDEIHLFHRERHHLDFTYRGQLKIVSHVLYSDNPSQFKFELV